MERKAVSGIMLSLLLISMLTLALNIQPVVAYGTIFIRADGSVVPSGVPISSVDNVTYTFTADIYEPIVVQRSNIIIDGNGYTLQGSGSGYGFSLSGINYVTIKKTGIKGFDWGVYLYSSSYNNISGNNITDNDYHGIWLHEGSNNNAVSGNNITNNGDYGVFLWNSNNNAITRNNITNNDDYGIWLYGGSNNNAVSGNNIRNNGWYGVYFWSSNNNAVSGNNITRHLYGVLLGNYSYYNRLSENNITKNSWYGVYLNNSYYNSLSGNNITDNWEYGIWVFNSSDNEIYHNNFITNRIQAVTSNSTNAWDGNYWSNYTGVDKYSGPYQNETGSDGVGDTPHVIDATTQDKYPLMNPWRPIPTKLTLLTLYNMSLYVNGTFIFGSSLKIEFYSYAGDYQEAVTLWSGTTPRHVLLSMNITHPLNWPIENATIVLYDGANATSAVASLVVHRSHLIGRLAELDYLWTVPGADRSAIMKEYVAIDGQWPYAPL